MFNTHTHTNTHLIQPHQPPRPFARLQQHAVRQERQVRLEQPSVPPTSHTKKKCVI